MELEELARLDVEDQWLVLLGRIAKETVSMETQLRRLHAQLKHDEGARKDMFDTPDQCGKLRRETTQMVENCSAERTIRAAILGAIAAAHTANDGRNRYMHRELLRHDQWHAEELSTGSPAVVAAGDQLQVKMASRTGIPAPERVTLETAHQLVSDLIGAAWRLRFARLHLQAPGHWRSELTSHVVGTWDGNADLMGGAEDLSD